MNDAVMSLNSIIDVNFLLINRIVVLTVTLIFFLSVMLIRKNHGQETGSSITAPIKLALFGMLLLVIEVALEGIPSYRSMLAGIQTIVVLLCVAKLAMYLIVDVYLRLHLNGDIPSLLRDAVRLVVYLTVCILSLSLVFKIDLSTIVTTTTVITATIAFAMQSTLTNAMSGFCIQTDRLLSRGNWISIEEKNIFGEIVNVGFRHTTLRRMNNTLLLVPNSLIMQSAVSCHGNSESASKPDVANEVMLGYDMPPVRARQLLLDVLGGEPLVMKQPAPLVRLKEFSDSGIIYRMVYRIDDPARMYEVQDRLFSRLWYAVTRDGFSFPFPHRQIISGESSQPFVFPVEQIFRELRQFDIFSMLDDGVVKDMATHTPVRVFGPGEVVVRQGDAGSSLYLVLKGELEVDVDGNQVGSIHQDSFFGEMSLLTGEPRQATVRSVCEVWLAEITREMLEPLLRANPELLEKISTVLATRRERSEQLARNSGGIQGRTGVRDDYLQRLRNFFRL